MATVKTPLANAVSMEAYGAPGGKVTQQLVSFLPDVVSQSVMEEPGVGFHPEYRDVRYGIFLLLFGSPRFHSKSHMS